MPFEGEFAPYEPMRRVLESQKVENLQKRFRVRSQSKADMDDLLKALVYKNDLIESDIAPDLILAFDGSYLAAKAENGFPGAELGYVTVASVLIDMNLVKEAANEDIIDPKKFRETEKASSIDTVFPGCNVVLDDDLTAKASMRKALFEELMNTAIFSEGETLLETYEALLKIKLNANSKPPRSPIEDIDEEMTYGYGQYTCPHTGQPLYSSDAMRLHELMNPGGSNGELYGQIMSTLEKLLLVHVLRAFEIRKWLPTLRRVAIIMDGPLAVFSTSSWLAKVIEIEIRRINALQKAVTGQDILLIGLEKSGTFVNYFQEIDTTADGFLGRFPNQSALLLDDDYIKKNIIFSASKTNYGEDTYFGRKLFYKTVNGYNLVPVVVSLSDSDKDLKTAKPSQFPRLADVMTLLDTFVSNRYPNSVSPLISAHAEAAIPLNLGKKIFENIAREIRHNSVSK
jgi:hypothetical protein